MTTRETGHDAASSEGTVTVTEAGSGTYTQQITLGHHRLVADEPPPIGDGAGPTPYDLLLAGLGACTSMTVRMYADRKGWPLDRVRVTLRHSRIHAEDCAQCETTKGLDRSSRSRCRVGRRPRRHSAATVTSDRRTMPCSPDPHLRG